MDFYFREEWRAPTAVGVAAFAAGIGVGWFVRSRRDHFEDVIRTVETVVNEETVVNIDPEVSKQLAMDFAAAVKANENQNPVVLEDDTRIVRPVLVQPNPEPEMEPEPVDDWNQEEEEADRGPDAPYVISRDEFDSDQNGYRQLALEYFAGDDILCDDQRVPIYNHNKIVGRLEFGRGSGDPNVVFIRNESLQCEYEVTRVHGGYQTEVLGMIAEETADEDDQNELKHSNRRFRDYE